MSDQAEGLRALVKQGRLGGSRPISRIRDNSQSGAQNAKERPQAEVIAISSGKGGVGKTNVTVNLGISLARIGRRVLILDGDFGLANVDVILGVHPKTTLADVIGGQKSLEEIVLRVDGMPNLLVIPGGSGLTSLADIEPWRQEALLRSLGRLSGLADIVLIDTAAGVSRSVSELILAADRLLVVTTPDPTAITDAYALIKVVSAKNSALPIGLVVNQVSGFGEGGAVWGKLAEVAREYLGVKIQSLGYLPYDQSIQKAVRGQQPVVVVYPDAQISRAFFGLAEMISQSIDPKHQATGGQSTYWEWLARPSPVEKEMSQTIGAASAPEEEVR